MRVLIAWGLWKVSSLLLLACLVATLYVDGGQNIYLPLLRQQGATATSTPTATLLNPPTKTPTNTPAPSNTPTVTVTGTPPTATNTPVLTVTVTATSVSPTPTSTLSSGFIYPLKASANGHYFVDQNNVPFLLKGDSAQAMIGALSETEAQTYLTSRAAAGFNAIWTHVLCGKSYSGCHPDGSTYDGLQPFTTPNDLSTPNPAYFARVDRMFQLAAHSNLAVFASAIETINWLGVLRTNGATKAYNYGVYLGKRYKNFPNLVWFHGNDFQTWANADDDAVVRAVAEGIQSVDPDHLHTVELNYDTSGSLDDPTWAPLIGLDAAYSYYPQYAQVLKEYNRASIPVIFWEGVYEYQDYSGGYLGAYQLRNQEYWTQLSGAVGQLYGNVNIFRFPAGWPGTDWQTSPGVTQFDHWYALFKDRDWYNLAPDWNHTVVTAGYGTFKNCCANANSDYLTAARTPDGKLVIAYMPTVRTITVDMAQLAGSVTARWYDPTSGAYIAIGGSPFPNSGARQFTPPKNNNAGDGDWVLLLEVN
ncbi:MAG: DUF4038 domain-containing protein [Caldilineaceae bacterium]